MQTTTVQASETRETLTGKGGLRHHFHGTYMATVAIAFADSAIAGRALPYLGNGWKVSTSTPNALVWHGTSEALETVKATLAPYRTDAPKPVKRGRRIVTPEASEPIDSIARSIDYGPPFTIAIPVG